MVIHLLSYRAIEGLSKEKIEEIKLKHRKKKGQEIKEDITDKIASKVLMRHSSSLSLFYASGAYFPPCCVFNVVSFVLPQLGEA